MLGAAMAIECDGNDIACKMFDIHVNKTYFE
jgi:hypothetical protein